MARSLIFLSLLFSLLLLTAAHGGGDHGDADTDGDTQVNLRSKSLILVKIWCLILVFVGTFIGGVSPYFLKWKEAFLLLGTQFAGGVFLGTSLMHFLSDAKETFEDLSTKEYPFAFMLACVGYLLTMLADCIIAYAYGKRDVTTDGCDVEHQAPQGVFSREREPTTAIHIHISQMQILQDPNFKMSVLSVTPCC